MRKIILLALIVNPAISLAQIDINSHVKDYVKDLKNPTRSAALLPKWKGVLDKQEIVQGAKIPTKATLQEIFDSTKDARYIADTYNYNKFWKKPDEFFDYWAAPYEFKQKGGGDCEDYVISWYYEARFQGFSPDKLNIWVGYIPGKNNLQHAVLAIEFEGVEYIFDNYKNDIIPAKDYMQKEFKLMYRFNEEGWASE